MATPSFFVVAINVYYMGVYDKLLTLNGKSLMAKPRR